MAKVFALRLDGASLSADGSVHIKVTSGVKPIASSVSKEVRTFPSREAFDESLVIDRSSTLMAVMLSELLLNVPNPATKVGKVVEATVAALP